MTSARTTAEDVLARVRAVELTHGYGVADRARVALELEAAARTAGDETTALRAGLLGVEPVCAEGDFARATTAATAAASHAEVVGDDELLARAHHSFAILSLHAGDTAEATWHAVQSVEVLPARSPAWLRALHLVCLSCCVQDRAGSFEAVIAEALATCAAEGAAALELTSLNNLAFHLAVNGRAGEALEVVERMRRLGESAGLPLRRSDLDTVATVQLAAGVPDAAWSAVQQAFDPATADSGPLGDVEAHLTAAEVLGALGRTQEAEAHLRAARAVAERRDLPSALVGVEQAASDRCAATGDWRGAFEAQVRLQQVQSRVRESQNAARAELAVARFDAERTRRDRDRYRDLAMVDPLTGLPNRRAVEAHAQAALAEGHSLAVALLDVDHFKRVNDERSHEVGDAVLSELGTVLLDQVASTPGALAARLGGEEFVVVWTGWTPSAADLSAEALRAAVADRDWDGTTRGIPVTVSIGCAATKGAAEDWSALLARADGRLYEAKRGGRDRVVGTGA